MHFVYPVWQFCARTILRLACGAKIDIQRDERSPHMRGIPAQGLYVANHQSYIDIPLIVTMFQVPPIMKKELLYIPVFGWLAWISGAMPVSRSSNQSRRKVFSLTKNRILQDKIGIQVYPEGTRSKTGLPKPFDEIKRTLLVFAYNEQIPVVPTSMYGTRGVLSPKGTIRPGRHLGIIVHKEILPQNFASADEFARACWEKVIEGHDQMKAELAPLNKN